MSSAKVYVKFPKAGLGNMLLTWSRAYVFAHLNNLEMHTASWTRIHYGAWLRGERKKRLYRKYFLPRNFFISLRFCFYHVSKKKIFEPPVQKLDTLKTDSLFVFKKIFTDYDFFKEIKPHRELIKNAIFKMMTPPLKEQFQQAKKPYIGVHVRRGDFKLGSTLTPISFFKEVINTLRNEAGEDLPVTIFTDAEANEIEELTSLNNASVADSSADIIDILLLASSKIAVLSIGSTFSYWAGFLSEGKIIKHVGEWHAPLRNRGDMNFSGEIFWHK